MNQLLSIVDDSIVIKKLSVQTIDGPVQATDDVRVSGNIFVDRDIKARKNIEVTGTITADTIKVKNLISENETPLNDSNNKEFTWIGKSESSIEDKGLIWVDNEGSKQLVYKAGNKLWSTMSLELSRDNSFLIDQVNVLSATALGPTVVTSSLRKVGELENLKVSGNLSVDGWAFFNSYGNSLGLNTESPNATLGVVVENGVEVIIGSKDEKTAKIGTFTSNTLDIVTNNQARMSIKDTGEIEFGNPKFKNSVVRIYGKLEVDEIVTGGIDKSQWPIVFKTTDTSTVYGTGFIWNHNNSGRYFIYKDEPDRIYSSEIIDLDNDKWFSIDNRMVLSKTTLGSSVTESKLESLGYLRELNVHGPAVFKQDVHIDSLDVIAIKNQEEVKIIVAGETDLTINATKGIDIGHQENTTREVRIHGQTMLNGSLSLNNKRITSASTAPAFGLWNKGDICYNSEPEMENYVGWVCVQGGVPGRWCPFGLIMPVRG